MHMARLRVWLLAIAALGSACARSSRAPTSFQVVRTSPDLGADRAPLLLNDSLTVYFSAPVQPLSVTADSFTLVDEQGHRVPGELLVGANWVTFQPAPPLTPELDDGSFRPGAVYRLLVAGSPRPDAVRAVDGRRLAAAAAFAVRIADRDDRPSALPAPLRPPGAEVPFVLRTPATVQQLPADAPRLQLHFSQPLLPSSVVADAFDILLLGTPIETLLPRSVRVVRSRLDDLPGSTVEIDLGALPRRAGDGVPAPLRPGDSISVALRRGGASLRDYGGEPPLPSPPLWWTVVAGGSVAFVEWPAGDMPLPAEDALQPAFEVRGGVIRPRVRVEAGNGELGLFRPTRDTVLRPGTPFDRGDGTLVVSRGQHFPFLAIDVPAGITVTVDASAGPVELLACGGVRLAGAVELLAAPTPLPPRRSLSVAELARAAPVAIIAAGDIDVRGVVQASTPVPADDTCLLLAAAGSIDLAGELPFQTMLAVESGHAAGAIDGPRGQSVVFATSFTHGVAAGADLRVRGLTPWRQLPVDRDGGVLHLREPAPDLEVGWQSVPADPVRRGAPDPTASRMGRVQPAADGDTLATGAGAFVRFEFSARVRADQPVPRLRELRLCDR